MKKGTNLYSHGGIFLFFHKTSPLLLLLSSITIIIIVTIIIYIIVVDVFLYIVVDQIVNDLCGDRNFMLQNSMRSRTVLELILVTESYIYN